MATRPVFIPVPRGRPAVRTQEIVFDWHPGLAVSQKQKSIASLHARAREIPSVHRVLEISSKSPVPLGVALSAFNLNFDAGCRSTPMSVECAFQGGKVFENGGPFTDIFAMTSREAKGDSRLQNSGRLTGFHFNGMAWGLEPQTAFYDWLYLSALKKRKDLADQLSSYSAFTDIEFNPKRSINCQAYSVALFSSLTRAGVLDEVTSSEHRFLSFLKQQVVNNARQDDSSQPRLF